MKVTVFKRLVGVVVVMAASLKISAFAQDISWFTANPGASTFYISTEAHLQGLSELVNRQNNPVSFKGKTIILNADITLAEKHIPIGDYSKVGATSIYRTFNGIFNGNRKTISNLSVTGEYKYAGLFGYIEKDGKIINLTVSIRFFYIDFNYIY